MAKKQTTPNPKTESSSNKKMNHKMTKILVSYNKPMNSNPKPRKTVQVLKSKLTEVSSTPRLASKLTEVAKKVTKPSISEETVRLYPKGEAKKRTVDSLKSAGLGKAIGNPIMKKGQKPMYGTQSSDVIKKALKKK